MNDLVRGLCERDQNIEVTIRPQNTLKAFKACIDRGYVHIKFTETRGGTELGVRLDPAECDFIKANFDEPAVIVHIAGELTRLYQGQMYRRC